MTSADRISPKELLELASLDALGLLDEFEAEVFTRAFHDSPASVQDEVLRLQSQVASDPTLLPGDEPDPTLRERVLKAVADAIARHDAPIARIGSRGEHAGQPFGGTSPTTYWRAATFVLAGASLIMAYFLAVGFQASNQVALAAFNANTVQLQALLGPLAKDFLLDESEKKYLDPVSPNSGCAGALLINEDRQQVMILADGLPFTTNPDYVLRIQLRNGGTRDVQTFACRQGLNGIPVKNVSATLIKNALRWEVATKDGEVLLRSA